MISGISIVDASTIYNNGIIIFGTLYGFDENGYFLSDTIEPGNGYWIRASEGGDITIPS